MTLERSRRKHYQLFKYKFVRILSGCPPLESVLEVLISETLKEENIFKDFFFDASAKRLIYLICFGTSLQ